jgi:1-deoxy-D-xylulose-5-phosphate synthase
VNFAQAGRLFEDLGITYIGLVPGHDIKALLTTFAQALELPGPVIVHVRTQKGRGFKPAEADQIGFHGAALPPMSVPPTINGNGVAAMPTESMTDDAGAADRDRGQADGQEPQLHRGLRRGADRARPDGSADRRDHRGHADRDRPLEVPEGVPGPVRRRRHRRAALRGARDGPGDGRDAAGRRALLDVPPAGVRPDRPRRLPERPAGAARGRPGRAGRRGRDEPPGDVHAAGPAPAAEPVIASPKDEQELRSLLRTGLAQDHPFALHYPRDAGFGLAPVEPSVLPIGRGEVVREGSDLLFVAFGPIVARAVEAADALEAEGWSVAVINARFAKPLDRELILSQARGKRLVATFEESVVSGGFGSGVLETIEEARLGDAALRDVPVRIVGIPGERFVDHGSVADLRKLIRLDSTGLAAQVRETLAELGVTPHESIPA